MNLARHLFVGRKTSPSVVLQAKDDLLALRNAAKQFHIGSPLRENEVTIKSRKDLATIKNSIAKTADDSKEVDKEHPNWHLTIKYESELPSVCERKRVFQEIVRPQDTDPIYTLEDAALPMFTGKAWNYTRYPSLEAQQPDSDYILRGIDNAHTFYSRFPDSTDLLICGSGLVGSATAYYTKLRTSRAGDVLVIDKQPYSPHSCTSICPGLISVQSKNRDISRAANITKELLRDLRNDIIVTKEDIAQIRYRPVIHLILWPERDANDVLVSVQQQIDDGLHTEVKLPLELEATFPFLKVADSDVAIGSHGNQDEALVDPVGLRNVYRSLAHARGAAFMVGEVIDFNTQYNVNQRCITPHSAIMVVVKLPKTGELRNVGFGEIAITSGHNTAFLEARAEMDSSMRDQIGYLHAIQPKLRIQYIFRSINAPTINFPAITDTDGSLLIREDYAGCFKYCLNYEESDAFLDFDIKYMDMESEDPFLVLHHKSDILKEYFNDVVKPRLVKRIPSMADAEFIIAISGYESYNEHDGSPIIGTHPFHSRIQLSAGYGSRMMTYSLVAAKCLTDLMLFNHEEVFDMSQFYFNRLVRNRKIDEFQTLKS